MSKKQVTITDLPGVGPATAEKLEEAGFGDLMSLAVASPGQVMEYTGMTEAMARKVINTARNELDMGFETGEELMKKRELVYKLNTGSGNFNTLLGGGFESGSITECYGQYGSGKCISKDTNVMYFEDGEAKISSIESLYTKKNKGETNVEEGSFIEVDNIEVLGFKDNKLEKTKSTKMYRQKVDKIYEVTTRRGRKLKLTGSHKLLSFDRGVGWKPLGMLDEGDIIAYPKEIKFEGENKINEDDAYFLGLYVAEGSDHEKIDISTGNEKLKDWVANYIKDKFDYESTVYEDKRRENSVYAINLRKPVKEILSSLVGCQSGSKHVPLDVINSSEKIVSSFLAGYLDGDGHFSSGLMETTTKSKRLGEELTYLFSKIGMSSSLHEKGDFYRVTIVGEDRIKLKDLPFKIKGRDYNIVNSSYGYPKQIGKYLRDSYKNTLGGNRGNKKKEIGKINYYGTTVYDYFTNNKSNTMNTKTMIEMTKIFISGLSNLQKCIKLCYEIEEGDNFNMLYNDLNFAFSSVNSEIGISKNSMNNYVNRGLPNNEVTIRKLKISLLHKLIQRRNELVEVLKNIKNIVYFNWDEIVSINEVNYNDYVYDFVVPEGHCFVGGNIPTILHNTALAHQLAVNAQLPLDEEGKGGVVVWIDTEGTLRPERIQEIAEAAGLDYKHVLRNIRAVRAFNSDHQMLLAEKVEDLIKKEDLPIKLVIVDSLMSHFRSEFVGRGTLADRQQKLNKHMHVLLKLAQNHNIAVYVTNQVMSKPDTFFGDPTEAIGGHIVAHASTTRVYLRRGKKGSRVAKLVDSPHLPDGECMFFITEKGILDA